VHAGLDAGQRYVVARSLEGPRGVDQERGRDARERGAQRPFPPEVAGDVPGADARAGSAPRRGSSGRPIRRSTRARAAR